MRIQTTRRGMTALLRRLPQAWKDRIESFPLEDGCNLRQLEGCYQKLLELFDREDGPLLRSVLERLQRHRKRLDAAREELILANLPLVAYNARAVHNLGLPFLDRFQEGVIGLMIAIERYEWKRGHRLSTYATWWIRRSITTALLDRNRLIRLPGQIEIVSRKMRQTAAALESSLGREATHEEVAAAMHVPLGKIRRLTNIRREPISLDAAAGDERSTCLADCIEDPLSPDPLRTVVERDLRKNLWDALRNLSPRERRIIVLRFGIGDEEPRTLREVGRATGISAERVRQIEQGVFHKLRKRLQIAAPDHRKHAAGTS